MRLVSERLDKDDKALQAHAQICTDSRARQQLREEEVLELRGEGERLAYSPSLLSTRMTGQP